MDPLASLVISARQVLHADHEWYAPPPARFSDSTIGQVCVECRRRTAHSGQLPSAAVRQLHRMGNGDDDEVRSDAIAGKPRSVNQEIACVVCLLRGWTTDAKAR